MTHVEIGTRTCTKCGTRLSVTATRCVICGQDLKDLSKRYKEPFIERLRKSLASILIWPYSFIMWLFKGYDEDITSSVGIGLTYAFYIVLLLYIVITALVKMAE